MSTHSENFEKQYAEAEKMLHQAAILSPGSYRDLQTYVAEHSALLASAQTRATLALASATMRGSVRP